MNERAYYDLADMEPVIRKVLAEGGSFPFYPRGTSMLPMIVPGQDQVILEPIPEKLRRYQIILYKREDGSFVLHRILRVKRNCCTMRGDHQYVSEPGVQRSQMIGKVKAIGKPSGKIEADSPGYRIKCALWVGSAPLRRGICALQSRLSKSCR